MVRSNKTNHIDDKNKGHNEDEMNYESKTKAELIAELERMHRRVAELEGQQTEQLLRARESELAAIYQGLPSLLLMVDQDRRVHKVNQAVLENVGKDQVEVIGLRGGEALQCVNALDDPRGCGFGPDCSDCQVREAIDDTLENGQPHRRREVLMHLDRDKPKGVHFLLSTAPVDMGEQQRVLISLENITERKQAQQRLEESEQKYRRLVEGSPNILYIYSNKRGALFWSQRVEDVLGFSPDELVREPYLWRNAIHPDDVAAVDSAIAEVERGAGFDLEYRIQDVDGQWHWFHDYFISKRIMGDELIIEGLATDITERKRAQEELHKYQQNLEELVEQRTEELRATQERLARQEKLAALGQLAGGVAHELRQPLSVIYNAIYFLNHFLENPDEKVSEYLDMLDEQAHIADHIITDLLEFARSGKASLEPVSAPSLIRDVLQHHPAPIGIDTQINAPDGLPLIYVDPGHLRQVLTNLITNAYQAMPQGGALTFRLEPQADSLVVAVTDTGVGISPENLEKIFEPLFTTKKRGVGLGLAISKKLVEANRGRLEVESQPGEGATFKLTLPVYTP